MDCSVNLARFMTFFVFVLHMPTIFASSSRSESAEEYTISPSMVKQLEDYFELSHQRNTEVMHWPQDKIKYFSKFALQILNAGRSNKLKHKGMAKILYTVLTNESTIIGIMVDLLLAQLENILGYRLTIGLIRDIIKRTDEFDFADLFEPVWEKIKRAHVGITVDSDPLNDSQNEKPTLEDAFKIAYDILTDEKALEFMFEKLEDPNEKQSYTMARSTYFNMKEIEDEKSFNLHRKAEFLKNSNESANNDSYEYKYTKSTNE